MCMLEEPQPAPFFVEYVIIAHNILYDKKVSDLNTNPWSITSEYFLYI